MKHKVTLKWDKHITAQLGWNDFGKAERHVLPLIDSLKKRKYDTAGNIIHRNVDIVNCQDDLGWTPIMMLLANVQNDSDVLFIKQFIKYVNINSINLNDMNYLLIMIQHSEPKHIMELFNILMKRNVDIEYTTANKFNALDIAIQMFHVCTSCNCDTYYFRLVYKLKTDCGLKSNKYPTINDIDYNITPLILDNLNESKDYTIDYSEDHFERLFDDTSLVTYDSIKVGISRIDVDRTTKEYQDNQEKIQKYSQMDGEELQSELEIMMVELDKEKDKSKDKSTNPFYCPDFETKPTDAEIFRSYSSVVSSNSNPYSNKNSNSCCCSSQNKDKPYETDMKGLKILTFPRFGMVKDMTNKTIPKCMKCKVSYTSSSLSIIMPCRHAVLCSNCAYRISEEKNPNCPDCYRSIEHIVIKTPYNL